MTVRVQEKNLIISHCDQANLQMILYMIFK